MDEDLKYMLALSLVPQIGPVLSKELIRNFDSAEQIFKASNSKLSRVNGVGPKLISYLREKKYIELAEHELAYCKQHYIELCSMYDSNYPLRMKRCIDSPIIFYYRGNAITEAKYIVSIVGTRNATEYGKQVCKEVISAIKPYDPIIVSGLAYGIDITAHKEALKNGLRTYAVLGHGLDIIYPAVHKNTAFEMLTEGGIISEFHHGIKPDRENFPARNRIIAALSDVVIVVEAKEEGGALITAEIASSYNRDILSIPGRIKDEHSRGCLQLIKNNIAQMVIDPSEIPEMLLWNAKQTSNIQKKLFVELSEDEQNIMQLLIKHELCSVDEMLLRLEWTHSKLASHLMQLELAGLISSMPGKLYRIC